MTSQGADCNVQQRSLGALHIFWARRRAIGKGNDIHNFGIGNGTDLQDFGFKH